MKVLTEKQVAEMLGVTDRTLQSWRFKGVGPRFIRISRRCVRYEQSAIEEFIEAHSVRNTAQIIGLKRQGGNDD